MAVIRPDPLVALTLDGDLDGVGAVVVGDGAGPVPVPDWKNLSQRQPQRQQIP
jgi:hypothetical protein